jgi:hypothetical protein
VTTRTKVRFGLAASQLSEVGTKAVDGGFDFLELGGSRWSRIVWYK